MYRYSNKNARTIKTFTQAICERAYEAPWQPARSMPKLTAPASVVAIPLDMQNIIYPGGVHCAYLNKLCNDSANQ